VIGGLAMTMSARPTLSHRLEYLALRGAQLGVRVLPERVALSLCALAGVFCGGVLRIRRAQVDRNLRIAFPDRSASELRRLALASYAHLGREAGSILRFVLGGPRGVHEGIVARTEWVGPESKRVFDWMRERNESGRGVILVTGHLGNWEVGGASMAARDLALAGVAVRQRNPLVNRMLSEHRDALGMNIIDRNEARRGVLKALEEGRTVGLVADQHVHRGGVWIPFFGRPASTPRGPAIFALRTGAPVVLGTVVRAPGWPQRYTIRLERIPFDRSGDSQRDTRALTVSFTRALERRIEETPEQYLWHHRRWRTPPPEEQGS
jgi:KDO2-lipid IV(A) lauroyltransferase